MHPSIMISGLALQRRLQHHHHHHPAFGPRAQCPVAMFLREAVAVFLQNGLPTLGGSALDPFIKPIFLGIWPELIGGEVIAPPPFPHPPTLPNFYNKPGYNPGVILWGERSSPSNESWPYLLVSIGPRLTTDWFY